MPAKPSGSDCQEISREGLPRAQGPMNRSPRHPERSETAGRAHLITCTPCSGSSLGNAHGPPFPGRACQMAEALPPPWATLGRVAQPPAPQAEADTPGTGATAPPGSLPPQPRGKGGPRASVKLEAGRTRPQGCRRPRRGAGSQVRKGRGAEAAEEDMPPPRDRVRHPRPRHPGHTPAPYASGSSTRPAEPDTAAPSRAW